MCRVARRLLGPGWDTGGRAQMPANKCDECGTKINRLKTPYKFKHGNHTHAFCDPP